MMGVVALGVVDTTLAHAVAGHAVAGGVEESDVGIEIVEVDFLAILLDELGSGTDPEEGAALAIALLEGLVAKKTMAVLTTHLTQLAAAALELEAAACAAMEFDPATDRPTYRLRPGSPGGSEALANPLGVSAALVTSDGFLLLGRRSGHVARYGNS